MSVSAKAASSYMSCRLHLQYRIRLCWAHNRYFLPAEQGLSEAPAFQIVQILFAANTSPAAS